MRLPLESDYSALRRLLISNRHSAFVEIKQALRLCASKKELDHNALSLVQLAQLFEQQRCEDIGFPYLTPRPLDTTRALRNCPTCSKQGYHARLYEYPWLKQCPFHHLPLLNVCPACHQTWPPPSRLLSEKCGVCSANISLPNVIASRRFDDAIFANMMQLEQGISQFQAFNMATMRSNVAEVLDPYYQASVTSGHPLFPSFLAALFPGLIKNVDSLGINSTEISERNFSLEGQAVVPCEYSVSIKRVQSITRRVGCRIITAIQKKYQVDPEKAPRDWSNLIDRISTLPELLRTAYRIWLARAWGQSTQVHSSLEGSEYYYAPVCRSLPVPPRWLNRIFFSRNDRQVNPFSLCMANTQTAPIGLSSYLFEMDLWRLFISIMHYLDRLNEAYRLEIPWIEFFNSLPGSHHPLSWFDTEFVLIKVANEEVRLLHPTYLKCGDLTHVELKIEAQPEVSTGTKGRIDQFKRSEASPI